MAEEFAKKIMEGERHFPGVRLLGDLRGYCDQAEIQKYEKKIAASQKVI